MDTSITLKTDKGEIRKDIDYIISLCKDSSRYIDLYPLLEEVKHDLQACARAIIADTILDSLKNND